MDVHEYEIGGECYTQKELVLSQEEALADIMAPLLEGETSVTAQALVEVLLKRRQLRKALAVVLVPKGQTVAGRDLAATEAHLGDHLTLSQQMEVINDFFVCNAEAVKRLPGMASELKGMSAARPKAPNTN
jgi:hypothetical protein